MLTEAVMGLCHSLNQEDQSLDCSCKTSGAARKSLKCQNVFLECKYFIMTMSSIWRLQHSIEDNMPKQ